MNREDYLNKTFPLEDGTTYIQNLDKYLNVTNKVMKNYQILLMTLLSFITFTAIVSGRFSHLFAGELNELGCATIALSMGILSLFGYDWKGIGRWLMK